MSRADWFAKWTERERGLWWLAVWRRRFYAGSAAPQQHARAKRRGGRCAPPGYKVHRHEKAAQLRCEVGPTVEAVVQLTSHLTAAIDRENELARLLAIYGDHELAVWVCPVSHTDGSDDVKVQVFRLSGTGGVLRATFLRSKTDTNVVHALQFIADRWLPEISEAL